MRQPPHMAYKPVLTVYAECSKAKKSEVCGFDRFILETCAQEQAVRVPQRSFQVACGSRASLRSRARRARQSRRAERGFRGGR